MNSPVCKSVMILARYVRPLVNRGTLAELWLLVACFSVSIKLKQSRFLLDQKFPWMRLGLLFFVAILTNNTAARSESSSAKPNVLFIVVDDLNNRLGCYGHPVVKTPNIDQLAKRSVRFDRAYVQFPFCNPSRASFLSGLRPGAKDAQYGEMIYLPDYFHVHGYYTAAVGKVEHAIGHSTRATWDLFEPSAKDLPEGKTEEERFPDGRTARRVAALLEQHRKGPFFIAAGFHKPHLGFRAPKKYHAMYDGADMKLPVEPAGHLKDIPPIALLNRSGLDNTKMDDAQRQKLIADYYACITFIDAQIGVMLRALDRLNLQEQTIVVMFSDHGFHLCDHGMWSKQSLFEPATRVPLIVSVPGRKSGANSLGLVELVDLYPTLADLCGLPTPKGVEGASFAPLLSNPQQPWKKAAFTVTQRKGLMGRSVRTENFRYIQWGNKGEQLYDYRTDPGEYVNLVRKSEYAKTVNQMKRLLQEGWQRARPQAIGDH